LGDLRRGCGLRVERVAILVLLKPLDLFERDGERLPILFRWCQRLVAELFCSENIVYVRKYSLRQNPTI
jgi:hypothetical protein